MANPWKSIRDGEEPPFAPYSIEYLYPGLISVFPHIMVAVPAFIVPLPNGKNLELEGELIREEPVAWRRREHCSPQHPICSYP